MNEEHRIKQCLERWAKKGQPDAALLARVTHLNRDNKILNLKK